MSKADTESLIAEVIEGMKKGREIVDAAIWQMTPEGMAEVNRVFAAAITRYTLTPSERQNAFREAALKGVNSLINEGITPNDNILQEAILGANEIRKDLLLDAATIS